MRGLSLVELMVSMLLGLILSGGMISAYLGARHNQLYDEQMAHIQENGRYAMRLISRELGMAGFFGGIPSIKGLPVASVGADCSDHDWALDGAQPLDLVNDYTAQTAPVSVLSARLTCLDGAAITPNTDLVVIKRTAADASVRRGELAQNLTTSAVETWYLRVVGGEALAWDKMSPVALRDPGNRAPSASYWEAVSKILFVRRYSDAGEQDPGIPSLCIETLAGDGMTSRCLVEGVENMQLEFGIDTDGSGVPNQYASNPTASEMGRAVVARVHLLLRSIGRVPGYADEKTYSLGSLTLEPRHDAYLRRVFSWTVLLRNHTKPAG